MKTLPSTDKDIHAMFSRIAPRYDLINRLMTFGLDQKWRRITVRTLNLEKNPAHYLDVATGTADLALMLASEIERFVKTPLINITAVDASQEMLHHAQHKIDHHHGVPISLEVSTMENLPFEPETFDGITIGFGIRNSVDRPKALKEMWRVLKPQGRLAILEALPPENTTQRWIQKIHMRLTVRFLGGVFSEAKAYEYLGNSVAAFPLPKDFQELLKNAGFQKTEYKALNFGAVGVFTATK